MNFAVAINKDFVGKLSHGDPGWKEFNNSFHPVVTNIRGLAREIYRGHAHCAVHDRVSHRKTGKRKTGEEFEYDGAYRDILNFRSMQTACLDFDGEKIDDSIAYLLIDNFIEKRAGLLYSTTSSTPEKPRTRVVFVLENPLTDTEDARLFNKALTSHYERADKTGSDVMKAWSGSLRCEVYINDGAFIPSNIVDGMIYHARRVEEMEKAKRERFLNGLAPDAMRDKLREALRYVPAQMDYQDWFKAVAAVYSIFPGEDGVAMIEEWSPGLPGEVARKFRTMRDVRIGPDWVFAVAYNRGWRDPEAYRSSPIGDIIEYIGG